MAPGREWNDQAVEVPSGDFAYGDSPLQLITVDGQDQVAVFGAQSVNGIEPVTGKVPWTAPHAVRGDRNHSTPLRVAGNILFVSLGRFRSGVPDGSERDVR
jgi:hypothetical protein